MWSRIDSLAARIAVVVVALVALAVLASVLLVGLSLRGDVQSTLERRLHHSTGRADAAFAAKGALLEALGRSVAASADLRSGVEGLHAATELSPVAERERAAMGLDLVAVLDGRRTMLAAAPPVPQAVNFAELEPQTPTQVLIGGRVYLAVLHEMERDGDRQVGFTVSAHQLGQAFCESLAQQTGVEVLLLTKSTPLGSALTHATVEQLQSVPVDEEHGQELGVLRVLAFKRGLVTVVLAQNGALEFARFRGTLLLMAVAGLLCALGAGALGLSLVRRTLAPLGSLTQSVHDMVAHTDFTRPLEVRATVEIRLLSDAFANVVGLLRRVLGQVHSAADRIGTGSDAMVATAQKSEGAASQHAESVRATSTASSELAAQARQIASSSGAVSDLAQKTLQAARAGLEGARAFTESMKRLTAEHEAATKVMQELSARMAEISRVVEFVNDVADKSELLALNAELEGHRAGVVGQSFSLVATEMRRLAENVTRSTREIEKLVDDVKTATYQAVGATHSGRQAAERASGAAAAVSVSLTQITSLAEKTSASVDEISTSTQQQTGSTDQLARSLEKLQAIAHESHQATRTLASANTDLAVLAHELDQLVVSFKV